MTAPVFDVVYRPHPEMDLVHWRKTLDELLVPNGEEPLLVWLLRECVERGLYVRVELAP